MLTVKNLNYQPTQQSVLWHPLNFSLRPNVIYGLVGINGVGKTTLLNLLSGLLTPSSGEIFWQNKNIRENLREYLSDVGYCLQNAENLFFRQTVKEELSYDNHQDVNKITKILNLEGLLELSPFELSGGQQKRLELAIMLLKKPKLLFCDEITAGLDSKNLQLVMDLLQSYKKDHIIVLVTHNIEETVNFCDEILFLNSSNFVQKTKNELLKEPGLFEKFGLLPPNSFKICQALIEEGIFPSGTYYGTNQEIAQSLIKVLDLRGTK